MHAIVFQTTLKTFYLQMVPEKRPKSLVWLEGFLSFGVFPCWSLKWSEFWTVDSLV